jgi:hypothetical protein
MPNPKARPDDADKMRDAITSMNDAGLQFSRPNRYQLKIGDLSFYPDKGTIFRDGDRAIWEQRGLDAILEHFKQQRQPRATIPHFQLIETDGAPPTIDLRTLSGN